MATLELCGLTDLTEAFIRPGGVHKVWNMLSLEPNLHFKFDQLDLWFDRIDEVRYSEARQPCALTDQARSRVATKSAYSIRTMKNTSAASCLVPKLALMAPILLSTSLQNSRKPRRLTLDCLLFTQYVLELPTCLALPNFSTSYNGMRMRWRSSLLMGPLLLYSIVFFPLFLSSRGYSIS